ncbi:MAG: MFS transporter [Clostridiales bacterium]|nr:MFS transporter [Clostridiales bacterium]
MKEQNTQNKSFEEKVSASSKFWLCSADCLCGVANGLLTGGGMSYFFVSYLGLKASLASIAWTIFAIWNAFNDPLFGYISDKTRTKLGRRIPYIRYGSFFYSLFFVITWVKWPIGASQGALFAQMLITLFLFDTLYTAIATSLYVMPYTMASSNKARSNIFLWKIFFSLISLSVPLVILPKIKPAPGESPLGFQIFMSVLALVIFLVIFASTFFYKERIQSENEETENIFKAVISCFKNRSFVVFEILSFTVIFIQTILMQGVIYYFDAFKNVPMAFAYGALGLGAVMGVILWAKKTNSWGIKKCMFIMCVVFAAGATAMVFFGKVLPIALICFFIAGMGFAGGMYLIPLMNGDVIDYDETVTGVRREGMYAGVNSFITKPAISFANSAFLSITAAFGFDKSIKTAEQSDWAKQGILVAWMAIPAVLLIICAFSLKFYPLSGKKWDEAKKELDEKHNRK